MFTTMSTLIPRAGTWKRLRWYSHLIVMSSRAIPYSARPPSAVAVFMARMRLAIRQMTANPPSTGPAISLRAAT